MKYRKKPVVIEAIRWTGNQREMFDFLTSTSNECLSWFGNNFYFDHSKIEGGLVIKTLEGQHLASIGDMIIKGVKGEFYPCKPDIFEATYDKIKKVTIMSDTDLEMENEIIDKGLEAPRVTLDQIDKLMERVTCYTHVIPSTTTTQATAMIDGFTLAVGQTACVDPKNFSQELGAKYAKLDALEKAKSKLWELEGYKLKFS